MLAEAVCKLEGFTYAPSEVNWGITVIQTETDHIYVTTPSVDKLEALSALATELYWLRVVHFAASQGRFTN